MGYTPNHSLCSGSGHGLQELAKKLCDRKAGIGADGVLVLEKSKIADFRMRIFNADGSEAEMCGNGLRCAILYEGVHGRTPYHKGTGQAPYHKGTGQASAQAHPVPQGYGAGPIPQGYGAGKRINKKITVETKAGIYEGEITGEDRVKVRMEDPKDMKLSFPLKVNGRKIKVDLINTGVPHAVIFVEGLDKIAVDIIGSAIRYHNEFKPKGTNANFVEIVDEDNIKIRTYERGVEAETLSCGTGSVASAIIANYKSPFACARGKQITDSKINVHTQGGILKVGFKKVISEVRDVYLEGEARIVFEGRTIL